MGNTKFLIYWIISLGLCWVIEIVGQYSNNTVGLGIISAIFMASILIHDILLNLRIGKYGN